MNKPNLITNPTVEAVVYRMSKQKQETLVRAIDAVYNNHSIRKSDFFIIEEKMDENEKKVTYFLVGKALEERGIYES